MPYIEKELRKRVENGIKELQLALDMYIDEHLNDDELTVYKDCAKMLTYTFYKILYDNYKGASWYLMGDADKILESVKDEFHRNLIHPHEDKAKQRNGDV